MEVKKENVIADSVSCNFCQRGELSKHRVAFLYPYEEVVTFKRSQGGGIMACICEECLDELYQKGKAEFKKNQ